MILELENLKMPIKVTPYQHQEKAFKFVMKRFKNQSGVALLVEMGCGKSLISVAVSGSLFKCQKIKKLFKKIVTFRFCRGSYIEAFLR